MNRRAFALGIAAVAAEAGLTLSGAFPGSALLAQGSRRFRAIVVDTKPLEARGASGAAAILRPQLRASLQRQFAGRIGGGGPTLIVRIHTLMLGPYAGPGGGRRGFSSSDYLEGEVSAGGERFPLLVTQDSGAGGAWYLPDNEVRRLRALADQFAGWVRRRV